MRRVGARVAAVLLATALAGSPSAARADAAQARAHFEKGRSYFEVDEYEKAIDEFKAAHVEKPDPAYLLNIAECYRHLGEYKQAVAFYRRFLTLAPANDPLRPKSAKRIAELQGKEDEPPHPSAPPPRRPSHRHPCRPPRRRRPRPRRPRPWWRRRPRRGGSTLSTRADGSSPRWRWRWSPARSASGPRPAAEATSRPRRSETNRSSDVKRLATIATAALAAMLGGPACQQDAATIVVVNVAADADVPPISQLRVTVSNAGVGEVK